jgi:hypothetical protein
MPVEVIVDSYVTHPMSTFVTQKTEALSTFTPRTRTAPAAHAYLEAIAAMAVTAVGENPVLAPVKFDLVINLETASA